MSSASSPPNVPDLPPEAGKLLIALLTAEFIRRLSTPELAGQMTAAELAQVRQFCSDNSITLASVQRGDFGETAKRVAQNFPFPAGPQKDASSKDTVQ